MEHWTSAVIEFNPAIINEGERIIEGVASAPVYDRANELITADALKKAVNDYMRLPIVTVGHKEFIAGFVKDLWFDSQDRMCIKVKLKETEDVDGIWELIKQGVLNAFSIAGVRKSTNCVMNRNGISDTPCVTDSIILNSITICGSDKCNPEAHFAIAKALGFDTMVEETTTQEQVEVPTIDYNELAKTIVDLAKGCGEEKEQPEKDEEKEEMKKTLEELSALIKAQNETITALSARLEKIEEIPFEKSLSFKDVDGHIIAVSADEFNKTVDMKATTHMDAREARKTVFKV